MTLKSVRSTLQEQPLEAFYKKMFLEIVKNSQENTVLESLFNNAAGRMAYQDTST